MSNQFKANFVSQTGDVFSTALADDFSMATVSNVPIHIGLSNTDSYISINPTSVVVNSNLQVNGNLEVLETIGVSGGKTGFQIKSVRNGIDFGSLVYTPCNESLNIGNQNQNIGFYATHNLDSQDLTQNPNNIILGWANNSNEYPNEYTVGLQMRRDFTNLYTDFSIGTTQCNQRLYVKGDIYGSNLHINSLDTSSPLPINVDSEVKLMSLSNFFVHGIAGSSKIKFSYDESNIYSSFKMIVSSSRAYSSYESFDVCWRGTSNTTPKISNRTYFYDKVDNLIMNPAIFHYNSNASELVIEHKRNTGTGSHRLYATIIGRYQTPIVTLDNIELSSKSNITLQVEGLDVNNGKVEINKSSDTNYGDNFRLTNTYNGYNNPSWYIGPYYNTGTLTFNYSDDTGTNLVNLVRFSTAGEVIANTTVYTSDDRLKSDEVFITNATETLNKLRPQTYNKWSTMNYASDSNATSFKESGLIAQEVFYDAPELRHLVTLPDDADSNAIYSSNITSNTNPSIDPSYAGWGSNTASFNYTGLIPYLIKALQEKDEELQIAKSNVASLDARLTAAGF